MATPITAEQQLYHFKRGFDQILPDETALLKLLKTKKRLNIKFGIDPRTETIHLGHAAHVMRLRTFRDMGHRITFIKGGFTARLGDPDGAEYAHESKYALRDKKEVDDLAELYFRKLHRLMGEFVFDNNATWFDAMSVPMLMEILAHFTLSDLEAREYFRLRRAGGRGVFMPELLYAVFQAYDSVLKESDVEIGGTDQIPNMLLGRRLQERMGMRPQVCVAYPVLPGTDGTLKMSVRNSNYISVDAPPREMYGKLMSIPDSLVAQYFELLTPLSSDEITSLHDTHRSSPIRLKKTLTEHIMAWFYPQDLISQAGRHFESAVQLHQVPDDLPVTNVSDPRILYVLKTIKWARSMTEARRLVDNSAVKVNGSTCQDIHAVLKSDDVIRVKHRYVRIRVDSER